MTSLKQLLHRKKPQPPLKKQEEEISLKDLAQLETATEQQIKLAIEKEPRLNERLDSLIQSRREMRRQPLELIEEKMERRRKVDRIVALIKQELHNREQQKLRDQHQKEKKWRKHNLIKLLPSVRWTLKDVPLLMKGLLTIDVMSWNTPTSTTIEEAGFDLNSIHPSKWREMLNYKFHPTYIRLKRNAMRYGKPMGKWRHGDETYERNKEIQIGSEVLLAIMLV